MLGKCVLTGGGRQSVVYPVVKIYATGVLLVEFRLICPSRPIYLNEFVRRFINFPMAELDELLVPPALARLAPIITQPGHAHRFYKRPAGLVRLWLHKVALRSRTSVDTEDDFVFPLAPLTTVPGVKDKLADLALLIMNAVAYVIAGNGSSWGYLLQGWEPGRGIGIRWTGRPHVHLIRFSDQAETASENESRHGDSFGQILGRVALEHPELGRQFLPPNSRRLDDYAVYFGEALTLWVHARRSIKAKTGVPPTDPNRGHFVYENQAVSDLIEYGYSLHWRFAEYAANETASPLEVLKAQRDLLATDWAMTEAGRFGDLRDMLRKAWQALGVPSLRQWVQQSLSLRQAEAAELQGREIARWGGFLAVFAALAAVPPVSQVILPPVWQWLGLPVPESVPMAQAVFATVGIALVLPFLLIVRWRTARHPKQR